MMPIKFAQDGSRFQNSLLIRRQQRHYIALEHLGKWIGPVAPPVPLARLRGVLAAAPLARAPHAHPRACRCRLLRLAFHQLPPQHPDLRVLYHGAASPGSISQTRRQDGDYRQFYLSRSSDLIVADQKLSLRPPRPHPLDDEHFIYPITLPPNRNPLTDSHAHHQISCKHENTRHRSRSCVLVTEIEILSG